LRYGFGTTPVRRLTRRFANRRGSTMTVFDRRRFIAVSGAAAAAGLSGCSTMDRMMGREPPGFGAMLELTASEAAARLRNGDMTAEAYAEALIRHTLSCQKETNAYITFDADRIRAAARAADKARADKRRLGPLHGVPLCIKDNVDTADLPTSGGTRALGRNLPPRHAPIWQRLVNAGAVNGGKTSMHELAFGITNNNGVFGAVRNPYDPRTIPGGSSGGTGAAVAARMSPAGLGSDTGGSVRIPAALCGIHGLRPTIGRYPGAGIVPISWTRDTAGPMARSFADLALLDGVITGSGTELAAADLKTLRIGVPREYFYADLDPATDTIVRSTLDAMRRAGATVVEANIADVAKLNEAVSFPVALWEVMRALPRYLAQSARGVTFDALVAAVGSPDVKGVLESQRGAQKVPDAAYRAAAGPNRARLRAAYRDYFTKNRLDALAFPTTPLPARPIGQDQTVELNGKQVPTFPTFIRNTDPPSNAGVPGISVAVGLTPAGLPVGLALDGPWGSDRKLLGIGAAVAQLVGKLPPPRTCRV
jgi:mandelamide amidase